MKIQKQTRFLLALVLLSGNLFAQQGRTEKELSGAGWSLWLDRGALWYDDSIFLPPVDISKLPVNAPTIGWEKLPAAANLKVNVPGTVEEHYWGEIGGAVQDTGGNYIGVSWWSRTFDLDPSLQGKRISLYFQSVNLRAEVFVNGKLVGYDVIGNTPFEVNATDAVQFGKENRLDVRITDPVGNFSWDDNILMRWGKNLIPAVHGFGGITGTITLRATDPVSIEDIYVQNQPNPKKVNVAVTLNNVSGSPQKGQLDITFAEKDKPAAVVFTKSIPVTVAGDSQTVSFAATVPQAKLWELSEGREVKEANVYEAKVVFTSTDKKMSDSKSQRFGFRWFDVAMKDNDKRFYLNGKRVFMLAAMTRGIWPKNGIFPTPEMARRDMNALIDFGLNTMLMHRAIGQPLVIDYSDSAGLFTYEEPGGYRIMPNKNDNITAPDEQSRDLRREKLRRMVIRDRSFPSMVIYNLKNEENIPPNEFDIKDMQMVHRLDPSRILTYNSGSDVGQDYHRIVPNDPFKLHILPFNSRLQYGGWWDQHHWFGASGYIDEMYRNPRFYLRGVVNSARTLLMEDSLYRLDKKEIIFFGEEGAFGAMVRLEKIKEELDGTSATGYREQEHLDWFRHYNQFLDETGFRKSFPSVDSLTLSLGRNLHYFHGRNIENVRLSNIADAYNMNGWASESTRTDVVDAYRYPTADPSIIRYYTQPLYVAVKLRSKVVPLGTSPVADFYIINQKDLKGKHTLAITFTDPGGTAVFTKKVDVNVSGGETFGQLLAENIQLPAIKEAGYYKVNASLDAGGTSRVQGFDDLYAVDETGDMTTAGNISVMEKDTIVSNFLASKGIRAGVYGRDSKADVIIIGNVDSSSVSPAAVQELMNKVKEGARLVVLEHADVFASAVSNMLKTRPYIYEGGGIINWAGSGRLFVGQSPVLKGLPQSQGMSWEYQCFYKTKDVGTNRLVSGLRLNNWKSELIVALGNQGYKDILASLVRFPVGKGSVMLSTLNILPNLQTTESTSAVAKRLFLNMLHQGY
ncbi:MAG TPA: glycoside hydrolase family 2 TIM barrel-domain containing protein [Chitinophagaceae bacterium]|nr:glycoside hydrolase family 2 TIM barrel-domain containing protein [Chitinophagaceae bacterium]